MQNKFLYIISINISLIIIGCNNKSNDLRKDYNHEANKLINQVIIDESCNCILSIPKESMVEINKIENRDFDFSKVIINSLNLKNKEELDSLLKKSMIFSLDTIQLLKNNISIIERNKIKELERNNTIFKKCPEGITYIIKPIFDSNFKKAIINCGPAMMCVRSPAKIYEYKNDKWVRIDKGLKK